jgi:hypothetical protein
VVMNLILSHILVAAGAFICGMVYKAKVMRKL